MNDKRSFIKFISILSAIFIFSLILGYIDLFSHLFGINFLARHVAYYPDIAEIGFRLNGLWGEPRDAIAGLLIGIILIVFKMLAQREPLKLKYLVTLIAYSLAIFFTFSISGYLGIFLGFLIFVISSDKWFFYILYSIFGLCFIYLLHLLFDLSGYVPYRVNYYYTVYGDLEFIKYSYQQLTWDEATQVFNIYPLLDYLNAIINGNFLAVIFGYGSGFTGLINSSYGMAGVAFPSSEGVRILVERGILGLLLFFWLFFSFAKLIPKFYKNNSMWLMLLACLIIGSMLGHRSHAIWILFLLISQYYKLFYKESFIKE